MHLNAWSCISYLEFINFLVKLCNFFLGDLAVTPAGSQFCLTVPKSPSCLTEDSNLFCCGQNNLLHFCSLFRAAVHLKQVTDTSPTTK